MVQSTSQSFFGPYSSRLDHAIHILENEDWLDIDTSGQIYRILMKKEEGEVIERG